MTGCSAKGCRNSTVKGFVMKRFPRDPARRSAWAANVKREGWTPTNASCLCEVHFDDSQWEDQDWGETPKLKRTAVPTLFCRCSYGKKRPPRISGSAKTANAMVMTEHSYGSTQGNETSLALMLSKGKVDRRYDHQYAIVGDGENQAKGDVKKVKVEFRSECHADSCPVDSNPKRRALLKAKIDRNNNGEKSTSGAISTNESGTCELGGEVKINPVHEELALFQVSDQVGIVTPQEGLLASLGSPINSEHSSLNASLQVQNVSQGEVTTSLNSQVLQLVLLPEQTKIKEESDIKLHYKFPSVEQPCAISRVNDDSIPDECHSQPILGSCIETKDHVTIINTLNTIQNSSSNFAPSASIPVVSNSKTDSVEIRKVRAAEKVLARQGRLVKRVAALQRQLTRQKHSHEVEIEKLMKRFHELEEKFDLTRSILRSCIGDDQFTVYATQNSRGVIWSKKTIEKAIQLRHSCGLTGYKAISKLLIPLPCDRTLQRYNQKSRHDSNFYVEIAKDTTDD